MIIKGAQLGLLLVVLALGFGGSVERLAAIWNAQPAYYHGWLFAPFSLFLTARALLRQGFEMTAGTFIGTAVVLLGVAIWYVAMAGAIQAVELAALPLLLLGAIGATLGAQAMRETLWPVALLYWTVPVWEFLADIALKLTVWAVALLLRMSDITAYIEGSSVFLAVGRFEIEQGCSGLHYLIVASALGATFGYLNLSSWRLRVVCIAISVLAAMALNWVRVFSIVVAGHLTDMRHYLVTVDHYWYGWGLFLVMLVPLFFAFHVIELRDQASSTRSSNSIQNNVVQMGLAPVVAYLFAMLLAIGAPVGFAVAHERLAFAPVPDNLLPKSFGVWAAVDDVEVEWHAEFDGAATHAFATYKSANRTIEIYRNSYTVQAQGSELINSSNRLFDNAHKVILRRPRDLALDNEVSTSVNEIVYRLNGKQMALLYVYKIGDNFTADPRQVKILQVKRFLQGKPAGGVLALRTGCEGRCSDEIEMLADAMVLVISEYNAD